MSNQDYLSGDSNSTVDYCREENVFKIPHHVYNLRPHHQDPPHPANRDNVGMTDLLQLMMQQQRLDQQKWEQTMQRQQEEKTLQTRIRDEELELHLLQRQEDFDKLTEAMTRMAEDICAHRLKSSQVEIYQRRRQSRCCSHSF